MKIFLSHAHEQAGIADALAIALRQEGHEVFLDRDALKAADGYHAAIRREIESCELFVFLVSPQSLAAGGYALTEMNVARERWHDPSGRVLPVLVEAVDFESIPPYLKAVSVLQPKGDAVAETLLRVAALARRGQARRWRLGAAAAMAAILVAAAAWWLAQRDAIPDAQACLLDAELADAAGMRITTLDAGPPGALRAFVVVAGVASLDLPPLTGRGSRWIIEAGSASGELLGRFELAACPTGVEELRDDERGLRLRLAPRR